VEIQAKVSRLFQKRASIAKEHLIDRVSKAFNQTVGDLIGQPRLPWEIWSDACQYAVDHVQRSILFWDALRRRGNVCAEHARAGKPPVLHFEYEMVLDARAFPHPVNYALVRIVPPKGLTVDPKNRPYVIIDPRAGHGPGIGGFKDDSQVGVALREGHPVYFVIFFPDPVPGQTLPDVTAAEQQFVRKVREQHPDSPKPVIIGNCQGGWAAMMLAAADPDDTGPIVINGAPMSYWGGAWREGEGDNPMRYAGGMLGGTWLASLTADLGHGIFDGAWLVRNFEALNPANTYWDKYYHLFANVDTELPRFLEFERWWGSFYLMTREEIEWITRNLFVGNKLWSGTARSEGGQSFDLRDIKVPIVLFASLGDNITPPQQAFNWVADVYGSTDEIKARGQVIVGLLHQDVGHLGIFVSGRVAKKEHAQIVSVLKSIESLAPGLYGMQIHEQKGPDGRVVYEVQFVERRLEEITERLNRFHRADEKPFEVVEKISEFNQQAYEFFARPLIQAMSNDFTAKLTRDLHPLRVQRQAISDLNPWLAWLGPAAEMVKAGRQALAPEAPSRRSERFMSECVSGALDFYREMRDALSEAMFYQTYAGLLTLYGANRHGAAAPPVPEPRELPFVKEALDSMAEGGYPEAVARVFALLSRHGRPIHLTQLDLKRELSGKYANLLPDMPRDQQRRIRGEQEIIVRYEPARALETLPQLLKTAADRERLNALFAGVLTQENLEQFSASREQFTMFENIRKILMENKAAKGPTSAIKTSERRRTPQRAGRGKRHGITHQRHV
jgi:pimeloyl-ACP methyl ester carboxylesterase